MRFHSVDESDCAAFRAIVGDENVVQEPKVLTRHAHDMTEDLVFPPQVVVRPRNTAEVSALLSLCHAQGIAVTPQGRRTSLSGGALPVHGGVALSMEHFDKILGIDMDNYQVTVEPYVLNFDLRTAVEAKGLFYPPDPASYRICSIGGNLAEGSGGPKCVKYGTTKDYVLNLEVVLADGRVIWTGANTLKNVTGYNLTQLFVVSEGTLGVITKGVLRLIPKPKFDKLMVVSFSVMQDAGRAVNVVLGAGIVPSAIEFMERNALIAAQEYTKVTFPEVGQTTRAHLILEFDGADEGVVAQDAARAEALLRQAFPSIEYVVSARSDEEKESLWKLRRSALTAAKSRSHCKEEDLVVPRSFLPQTVELLDTLKARYGIDFIAWGHAGDGNLHVCLMQKDHSREEFERLCVPYLHDLFAQVCGVFHGAVTAEHGVGYVQRGPMADMLGPDVVGLMRAIKTLLDPRGILNPGKIFLD